MKLLLAPVFLSAALAQQTFTGAASLDEIIQNAIQQDQIPGAVVHVGQPGRILYRKAYGNRSLVPSKEAMTEDTIFDAASLTKVVATTSAIMKLFEQGKIRLADPVTQYLPEFQHGKSRITVRQLLTHFSGLRPDLDLRPVWSGYQTGIDKALNDKPVAEPGERFIYSDINFILLGEIVHKLSGKPLNEFVRDEVFVPAGMTESMFRPPDSLRPRIAPTEQYNGMTAPLRGVVHDETSRFMTGVAGHAGLFTTATDLARFADLLLNQGQVNGKRIFSPLTIHKFTEPQTPGDQAILRGLGWDIDSPFSANRGELFPLGSFGHTGFTGTSLWIDPTTKTYVILLANSVHPHRRPAITSLRARVATIAAAALGIDAPGVLLTSYNETFNGNGPNRTSARVARVMTGIDVLETEKFARLRGKRVALITNHSGFNAAGRRDIDLLVEAGIKLTAVFAPEHGITGKEDREDIANSVDTATKVPVLSLYQKNTQRPNPQMLKGVDTLVFDIQDVGARFYTYSCTLLNTLEEAGKAGIPVLLLDRPNPITGTRVEGPLIDKDLESFVGCFEIPLRHGMTLGEFALMVNAERRLGARLEVVKMKNWQRGDWFDSTGLTWVDPSPNIRSLNAALLFPGVAMIEYSRNYSVGRGTDSPFEQVGAEFIDGRALAERLNSRLIPGIRAYPTRFAPSESNLKGKMCNGVRFVITDRNRFNSVRFGTELIFALKTLYPGKIDLSKNEKLIGSRRFIQELNEGLDPRAIETAHEEEMQKFLTLRSKYLLY